MTTSRRLVQITDKEINKIKITFVKIPKQLFASSSVIFGEYLPVAKPDVLLVLLSMTYKISNSEFFHAYIF